jgi:hypothetical protein
MNKDNPIIKNLISLDLPADDFAVFGSGTMYAHGIKDLGHDIDLVARGKAWEKALTLGTTETTKLGGHTVVTLFDGEIEIFNGWAPGEWNTDELIDTAEIIDGIRFVGLDTVVKWKRIMGREKDFEHIKMIEDYLKQK